MSALDPRALRNAFGAFATGVTVVTSRDGGGNPIGFTANSFASVSLDPPLLLVCLAKSSRNYANVTGAPGFAVNVLAEGQQAVSNTFARPVEDRFAGVEWREGPAGSPVFPGAAAWFDCSTEQRVDAGDHVVLIGRVEAFENFDRNGLGYVRGAYFTPALGAQAVKAAAQGQTVVSAVVERDGAVLLLRRDGTYRLPCVSVEARDPVQALETELFAETGLQGRVGFLFSVFEDRATGRQNLVYRVGIEDGEPRNGAFFALQRLPFDDLAPVQTADILRRFARESEIGAFGLYVGDETAGRVHPLARKD